MSRRFGTRAGIFQALPDEHDFQRPVLSGPPLVRGSCYGSPAKVSRESPATGHAAGTGAGELADRGGHGVGAAVIDGDSRGSGTVTTAIAAARRKDLGSVRNSECADTSESAMSRRTGHLDGLTPDAAASEQHPTWLDRRGFKVACVAFAAYAAVAALTTAGQDRVWALWALPGYGAAALLLWRGRGRAPALLVSVALALVIPLTWLSVKGPLTAGMIVVGRSAELLLGHGLPYLPPDQLSSWLSYNPYLPLMALFGMPKAAGLAGLAGDPGVWMALVTVALLAVAISVAAPHPVAGCRECRRDVLVYTALAVVSPLIALNLAVITTDPPVLALMLLSLALAARPARALRAGLVLGVACAMKVTAWPEVPVLAAMFWSRDGGRAAWRFAASSAGTAVVLMAATAPAAFAQPAAVVQNAVLFPLGLTRHKTPAESLLPGHLLASTGSAGRLVSIALLLAAAVTIAVSLVIRPPGGVRAATLRLAVGLAVIFTVGPNDRFGYFVYPLGLLGWLALTSRKFIVIVLPARFRAATATGRGIAASEPLMRRERPATRSPLVSRLRSQRAAR